ncbi:MAG: amidohydrolase family protein [Acidimicrobiales bacterium]
MHRELPGAAGVVDLVIDAHAHLGPTGAGGALHDSDAHSLVRIMDRCGVHLTMLSSHESISVDSTVGNKRTADAVGQFPQRLLGYLTVNPWQDPEGEIERWVGDSRFAGIKLHPAMHDYMLDGPRYQPVWDFAAGSGCPVLTHTWHPQEEDDMDILRRTASAHPEVTLLAGHSGGQPQGFEKAIEVARDCPNVLLEVCSSYMRGSVIARMVAELGASRVVFGSDVPFVDLRFSLARTLYAGMSADELLAVMGGNISTLLDSLGPAFGIGRS